MTRLRFPLSALMVVILLIGAGLALLKNPTQTWASLLYAMTLAILSLATALSLTTRARRRTFWIGFSVFGWVFFGATFLIDTNGKSAPLLPTKMLLDWLSPYLNPSSQPIIHLTDFSMLARAQAMYPNSLIVDVTSFQHIGQLISVILIAFVGAILTSICSNRIERSVAAGPNGSPDSSSELAAQPGSRVAS